MLTELCERLRGVLPHVVGLAVCRLVGAEEEDLVLSAALVLLDARGPGGVAAHLGEDAGADLERLLAHDAFGIWFRDLIE